ncbi:Histone-lysine N-methyltransferase, H3 lysine-9 specific SUVH5 [Colletotrichum siamense]|uniref:Histone-lysine N-methyltransferase, H3 lysine-9 specific SUVH5 n=1 Tax=Colletotrichum siamense TaxID=690259 RepID=UPI0018727FFE|nr:Histone-lysine N-methyltransferase, H3 lysine-9 specific SUVH5 [Colletotrichum siamense]KAF5511227.1 Histone-lysine N-methyltransferase, H3 lysine-9 specific SUVH5 [Colletotrichum siamense]
MAAVAPVEEGTGPPPAPSTQTVPTSPREHTPGKYFAWVNKNVLGLLAIWSKRPQALDESTPRVVEKKQEFADYLNYVEACKQAFPNVLPRELCSVDTAHQRLTSGLKIVCNPEKPDQQRYFSDEDKRRAQDLYDWAQRADALALTPPASDNETTAVATTRRPRTGAYNADSDGKYPIRKPAPVHPVWGRRGIMHGVALTGMNGKTQCLNPDYLDEKREAAVIGHNGLTVGDWFASQIRALFVGAHGCSEAGIHGRKDQGAYSVIVSGTYDEIDVDNGDVLYYSGSRSLEHKNPTQCPPRSNGTTALHVSQMNGRPVRVLRKASSDKKKFSVWAPLCGMRYDGLYRVTWSGTKKNTHNGLFEQFKLVRLPNQTPLEDLREIPSIAQRNDYARVSEYF